MNRSITLVGCLCVLLTCAQVSGGPWDTVIFRDDFDSCPGPPNPNKWIVNNPGVSWRTLGRTNFPNPTPHPDSGWQGWVPTGEFPRVENGKLIIEHHLFNPYDLADPNIWFLGGEVHTVQEFDPAKAYRFEARVRWNEDPPYAPYPGGLVNSFFLYGFDGSKNDEIDIEFLSKLINNGYTVTTNTYNESCQKPHCPCLECPCDCPWVDGCTCVELCSCVGDECVAPQGLVLSDWNTFRIYWYPSPRRIEWTWVLNPHTPTEVEIPLREPETDPFYIPDEPMALFFNFWAPDPNWGCAHDGSLQPVNDPNLNQISAYEIDYVEVRMPGQANFDTQVKLTASDAAAHNWFGQFVSVSGDTAVVGAWPARFRLGSAYVFRFNGSSWVEERTLTASGASGGGDDYFGTSISVSGDTVVVGAPGDDCAGGNSCGGSAYVFRYNKSSWVEEQKLTASDAGWGDGFGSSVSVSQDTVVVGASWDDFATVDWRGSAYVFRFNGSSWVEEQKLTASDAAAEDHFGVSVSLSQDTAVVGAYMDDCGAGGDCGSTYVFRFNGNSWVEEQKLTASDAGSGDVFGGPVSVSQDTVVVGASGDGCAAGVYCGSAYVYRFNGTSWVEEQKLIASDAAARDYFGASVSVSGDTAVVGAFQDDCAAGDWCGSAYVYRFNGTSWVEEQKLTAIDAAARDYFGASVSVSQDTVMVGAYMDDCEAGVDCGSVYVFFSGAACGNAVVEGSEACDEGGESATCDADCTFVECDDGMLNVTAGEECEPPGCDCCDVSCHFDASGTVCADDGNPCTDDVCDGAGTCEHPSDDTNDCNDGAFCNGAERCESGLCVSPGDPCIGRGACNESCNEADDNCFDPPGTNCGGGPTGCSGQDTCDGAGSCVANDLPAGTACGDASDTTCDNPDTCDGIGTCLPNLEPAGAVCRPSQGLCDIDETCDGILPECPQDVFAGLDVTCREAADACDMPETCTGSSPRCPSDNLVPNGTECRPAEGECDIAEFCSGVGPRCPANEFVPASSACGDPSETECDEPDTCDGAGMCVANYVSVGTPCDIGDHEDDDDDDGDHGDGDGGDDDTHGHDEDHDGEHGHGDHDDHHGDDETCNGLAACDGNGACVRQLIADCNENGIEDACDIEDGTSRDCNGNDVPDECDIADGTSADDNGDGVPDECEGVAHLDIRPGKCPNRMKLRGRRPIPIAVAGSNTFDVARIDPQSLALARADGIGGIVRPLTRPHGHAIRIKDVATPFDGGLCDCHKRKHDGIDDLLLKFSTADMVEALELDSLSGGAPVVLTLTGSLSDGSGFEASDCIVIPEEHRASSRRSGRKRK